MPGPPYILIKDRDSRANRRAILYQDNHCLAVAKHAGDLVQPDKTGDRCLAEAVQGYLERTGRKPGRAYLGVLHRLDRPVSGVVLFARTSKAAARLAEQFRERTLRKVYWALVEGRLPPARSGKLEHFLIKDARRGMAQVVTAGRRGAKAAALEYRVIQRRPGRALLEVHLLTGVYHQIRAQLAHMGCPVAGDVLYGAREGMDRMIALHAHSLTFRHPVRDEDITVTAPIPRPLLSLQRQLGLSRSKK